MTRISYLDVSSDEEEIPRSMRIFVIGESCTGKTSFIKRIVNNEFSLYYTQTKSVEIYDYIKIGDKYIQFVDININIIKHAPTIMTPTKNDAIILMITSRENLHKWWKEIFVLFACNVWIASTKPISCPDYIPVERFFIIDNMSKNNIYELLYDIISLV